MENYISFSEEKKKNLKLLEHKSNTTLIRCIVKLNVFITIIFLTTLICLKILHFQMSYFVYKTYSQTNIQMAMKHQTNVAIQSLCFTKFTEFMM